MLISLIKYIKLKKKLDRTYSDENIIENLTNLFGYKFNEDWVGRIYTVVNPSIDRDGNYNLSNQIFEFTEDGLINHSYIEKFIFDKLSVADQFIKNNNLFEVLYYDINKIDDKGNYLFVMYPFLWKRLKKSIKLFIFIEIPILVLLIIGLIVIL